MFDIIVIGCGFAGAVAARKFAEEKNKKVLLLEKRSHIAGNMYEDMDINGIYVHRYGPHIFHTNLDYVFEYLKRFSDWFSYEHRVLGRIDGQLVPIPFNFTSIEKLFSEEKADIIKKRLIEIFLDRQVISVMEIMNNSDEIIKELGQYIFEKVFINYTAKQWGIPIEQVDGSVISRVPVVLGYDDRYFQDKIQVMPKYGYTKLFEKILNHPNITIKLNCNAAKKIKIIDKNVYFDGEIYRKPIIYTGAVDDLLNYKYGELPYRSLDLVFERYDVTNFQPCAVVNYPNEEDYTRITEFKYLTGQVVNGKTTILKEYPLHYNIMAEKGNIPYYPIINERNLKRYEMYKADIERTGNIFLCGRLAEYKYYNMDAVVDRAIKIAEEVDV
ncbi:UDP-galactopyranose mutase [Pelotomaculum isophthalicicum JI]|uniref:UDP-galactopyranose mutase n=1 Tax=Pelotomaculum isophthalicicum JI TaxID=947010 RepID=A0A9X4H580_9FIRM|nr:UDP-galactopyranose mutase [Pelotomaculum isophthalicicum]MDF9407898.1 UDP-galactopyranose mutase [Pelotomaculum isophthalicicum JI]